MDRFRQKPKKEKPMKYVERDKSPVFITDVKTMKENIKIKEILRTVKMNSSMRIKAPKGSKVMQNKDFNDNEDILEGGAVNEDVNVLNTASATNLDVVVNNTTLETDDDVTEDCVVNEDKDPEESILNELDEDNSLEAHSHESSSVPDGLSHVNLISCEEKENNSTVPELEKDFVVPSEPSLVREKERERKLSLDQTMLSRREGLSRSELDLNSIGKSPLERKSSFFRKTMDSFLKNTTEIFRKQSIKSQPIKRRGSMSVSLQSLNEHSPRNNEFEGLLHKHQEELGVAEQECLSSSALSLQSSLTPARSASSLSTSHGDVTPEPQSEGDSFAGSRPVLTASQPLADINSDSIQSFNEAYIQESLLNSRAISMSSGLDSAHGQSRRKNRMNRVTWLASEGLTNYLRRIIQDEKSNEIQASHSFQDFSAIPQNNPYGSKTDSKGRRLSYQRAVSGEDHRYYDSSLRRKQHIPECSEAHADLVARLAHFQEHGVPTLVGYHMSNIRDEAFAYMMWALNTKNVEDLLDWKKLAEKEASRQAVIRELVTTEANYIKDLMALVELFMASAHSLQDGGRLLDVDTEKLFTNIPDVLNASLNFWETAIFPMLQNAANHTVPFNTNLMAAGFCRFRDLLAPYEKYVNDQTKALDYLRSLSGNAEFMTYLTWCYSQKACNRLQLSDMLSKPMQRLTKYSLILQRIIDNTEAEPDRTHLQMMESCCRHYVLDLNRSIRQREELEALEQLINSLEPYELDIKDEEIEKFFRMFNSVNLKAPMVNCNPNHSRVLIYQGDIRFKDTIKEVDARVFILTDMILVCKKVIRGGQTMWKLIRPKYFIEKMVFFPKTTRANPKDITGLVFVVLDDVGTSYVAFSLLDTAKEPNSAALKIWEHKFRQAKLTYELAVWFTKNLSLDASGMEFDYSIEYASQPTVMRPVIGQRMASEDLQIERDARETCAAMMHTGFGASTEYDITASMATDSFEGEHPSGATSISRPSGHRYPMQRNSTGGTSRNSRLSSFQQSTSAASHDDPPAGPSSRPDNYHYRAGSSVEHVIPPLHPDDGVTSITVNVVSESGSETIIETQQQATRTPTPNVSRSSSASRNTLQVQGQHVVVAMINSMPDLSIVAPPPPQRPKLIPSPQSASEKLYQSHQELLQRNRLSAQQYQHYLSPHHRGKSYPPPSPTRASLRRGLAFSYSFKNPPLSKMGHVNSQSQIQAEAGPSGQITRVDRGSSPVPGHSSSQDTKPDKKSKKHFSSRSKSGGSDSAGDSRKGDKPP